MRLLQQKSQTLQQPCTNQPQASQVMYQRPSPTPMGPSLHLGQRKLRTQQAISHERQWGPRPFTYTKLFKPYDNP